MSTRFSDDSESSRTGPSPEPSHPPFALGRFTVHPDELCLRDGEQTLRLQQKEMRLLLALVERAESGAGPLPSADLRRAVWGDQAITDGAAKNLVWQLRNTLGESADAPRLIHTVPGAGYRLGETPRPLPEASPSVASAPGKNPAEKPPVGTSSTAEAPTGSRSALLRTLYTGLAGFLVIAVVAIVTTKPAPHDLPATANTAEPAAPSWDSLYGAPRPIGGVGGREWDLDLDPSGRYLLFAASEDTPEGKDEPPVYYRLDLESHSQEAVPLFPSPRPRRAQARWSPDGKRIAFVQAKLQGEGYEIRIMDAAGGPSKVVADELGPHRWAQLAWRRDGRALFVARRCRPDSSELYQLELADGSWQLLSENDSDTCVTRPAASPDSRHLAFLRWPTPHTSEIVLLRLDSREERILARSLGHVNSLDWHPDGRRLFLTSNFKGASTIWTLSIEDGGPPQLFRPTAAALDVSEVTLSDTGRIVFEQSEMDIDILGFRDLGQGQGQGQGQLLTAPEIRKSSDRADFSLILAPDGKRTAFLTDRSGALELWISNGVNPGRRLPIEGIAVTSVPRWSPDGTRIALSVRTDGQEDLVVVRVSDGHVENLTDTPEIRELLPSWRSDGLALRFTTPEENGWKLWEQELWNPSGRRLVAEGGQSSQEPSPGRLFYTHAGEGLFEKVGDAEPRLLPVDIGIADWGNWQATEKGIYSARSQGKKVRFYDFQTGETTDVLELEHPVSRAGLSVSPDGRRLFVSQIVRDITTLMTVPVKDPS